MNIPQSAQYYEESGAAPPVGIVLGLGIGTIAAVILAVIYAYLLVYNPLVYISALASAGFGGLVGFTVGMGLNFGKVRSVMVSLVGTLGVLFMALYVSWAVWVFATLNRANVGVSLGPLFNPVALWESIVAINKTGAWSIKSATPTGAALWICWSIEAAIIFGVGLLAGLGSSVGTFCERCNQWCEEHEGIARLGAGVWDPVAETEHATIATRLDSRDLAALDQLGPVTDADDYYRVDLASCQRCNQLHAVSVEHVKITYDKEGESSEDTTTVVDKLLVSQPEAEWIHAIEQRRAP